MVLIIPIANGAVWLIVHFLAPSLVVWESETWDDRLPQFVGLFLVTATIIIIITRPKPAYGRQGLAVLWGQDTDQAGTFWGVVNFSLRAFGLEP